VSYIDPASSIRVEELLPIANRGNATYAPSYSAPTFTQGFDSRPYMRAMIVVAVETASSGVTLDIKLQKADSPSFSSYGDITGAAFTQITPSNDNQTYMATVDLAKHQNSVGVHAVVTHGGANRVRFGVYAILFPYDTTNSGAGTNVTNEFDI
jgi:hypothetical protein